MNEQLPLFNLSLKKVLASEPNYFTRAKIKIVLAVLIFSILKAFIALPIAIEHDQYRQIPRLIIIIILFLILIKIVLYRPQTILIISHIILVSGIIVIYTNLFIYAQELSIFSVQMIFMASLCSYYLVGGTQGIWYTIAAIMPALYLLLTKNTPMAHFNIPPEQLTPVGFNILVILNFLTFLIVNTLFYQAFQQNLEEKETLNQKLLINIDEARALAESRAIFLSTMSHELRTPLNGVIGMTNLLKDKAVDEQKDYLNILEFSATNLMAMINDVLDYNKSELDKIELEALPVNLSALFQKIGRGLEMRAIEKGLNWVLELDERLKHCLVITDPTRLTQIIYNLAGNAIKFTDNGTVMLRAIVVAQTENQLCIQFSVNDTGIGISSDRQAAIFDPFIQASTDTTRKYGGTGLGLAIVKRLLKLFNSDIALESELGQGSAFSFTVNFPLYLGELSTVNEFKVEKTSMNGLRLLIVEDNRVNALILEKLLSKWDIQTVVAQNGKEALAELAIASFDGILMDIHMPVMDGYVATQAIRAFTDPVKAKIHILAITASVSHNIHTKIKEAGMHDYVTKPFQTDLLYEKIQQIYKSVTPY
ncbi:MAG TPA: ATP-binding protein [Mucilaginibacter sp.]